VELVTSTKKHKATILLEAIGTYFASMWASYNQEHVTVVWMATWLAIGTCV
jgi:hypothetical protein